MKKSIQNISMAAVSGLFISMILSAKAQKLPAVQEASVPAPANVKVDAKLGEWNDNFQALNKTTDIYYTMANDANNLYLVMKSADQANNNKIIGGGINLTINKAGKKTEKDAFVVSFPVANMANLRNAMMSGMSMRRPVTASGANTSQQGPDSAAIADMRKKVVSTFKEIKLIGFKDIPDSVISIYNEYGIKAFVDFDDKGSLVVEMAVPLKELGLDAGAAFAYNIKLNGINLNAMMGGMRVSGGPGGASFSSDGGGAPAGATTVVMAAPVGGMAMGGGGGMGMPRSMGDIANMLSPTDFWGKYTLFKK